MPSSQIYQRLEVFFGILWLIWNKTKSWVPFEPMIEVYESFMHIPSFGIDHLLDSKFADCIYFAACCDLNVNNCLVWCVPTGSHFLCFCMFLFSRVLLAFRISFFCRRFSYLHSQGMDGSFLNFQTKFHPWWVPFYSNLLLNYLVSINYCHIS